MIIRLFWRGNHNAQQWVLVTCIVLLCAQMLGSCDENSEQQADLAFEKIPSAVSGIDFENTLKQTDDFNIVEYLYFYNGGGIAVGDINHDSLPDLYFTSNQGPNKLYLNEGNFKFKDITKSSGTEGIGNWKTGVTMADVNDDGHLDLFVCGVGGYKKFDGRNQLLINNGDLTFTDRTEEFGLAFSGLSTQSAFFDYDNDGDLDMFLLNHSTHTVRSYGEASLRFQSDRAAGDKLYRNELIPSGKTKFKEVTSASGIYNSQIGYGLGLAISDLNKDGFADIYVSNDFHENDYLYINQGNGQFKEILAQAVGHTSRFSMGNDVADFNNDGLPDIITLDMLPKDEAVIKTTAGDDPYDIYEFKVRYGYHHQLARNTLQLNTGNDQTGNPTFSDIAPMAGVEATDWSWSSLFADFDNDGNKDLFIANGILRRPNDLDYITYISSDSAQQFFKDDDYVKAMPSGQVNNFIFRNTGDLTFEEKNASWIGTEPSLSTGAAYTDLDRDGNLDLVVNNINDKAGIFRNNLPKRNFLNIEFTGAAGNKFGLGAKATVYCGGKMFYGENNPVRGWQSAVEPGVHFGLAEFSKIDSVMIEWPGGKTQILKNIPVNHTIACKQSEAIDVTQAPRDGRQQSMLTEVDANLYKHEENPFVAFNAEKLIPHMLTTEGPKISGADLNGDQLDDFFIGGASGKDGAIFIQNRWGEFVMREQKALQLDRDSEDAGSSFFDVDNNGTMDLIVVSGGQQFAGEDAKLKPRLYKNDGKGNFTRSKNAIEGVFVNASCVRPADIDNDGDLDLFIGGRVISGQYGLDPTSYVLVNDGTGNFKDKTTEWLSDTNGKLGMVADAVWTDLNGDNKQDLIVVGEWMPITILVQNAPGHLIDQTSAYGLGATTGWWNTLVMDDFDNDGDQDFVAGNYGLNSRLKASPSEPIEIYIGDIDGNGSLDQVLTRYNAGKKYPFISRDQLVKQVPSLKKKFLKYKSFANVTINDILSEDQLGRFLKKKAEYFASAYFENTGSGKFQVHALPTLAQVAPIFSIASIDVNGDGFNDLVSGGNLFSIQPDIGRSDASYGLIMLNEKGKFEALPPNVSGFHVRGEIRSIHAIQTANKNKMILIGRNNSDLLLYKTDKR